MNFAMLHPMGYDDRPRGHEPDHFEALFQYMGMAGHYYVSAKRIREANVLIFNSDVWHVDSSGTECRYDWDVLNAVIAQRIPVVWIDNFDHGGTDKCVGRWPGSDGWTDLEKLPKSDWARFGWLMSRPGCCRILYFMRKMQIHQDYPHYVYPLEYPILEDFPLASREEFLSRHFDVCGLANISLQRAMAIIGLYRDGRLKLDCEIVPHYRRVDYYEWLKRHRNAKLFLDADASLGSERSLRLITVAAMLRVKSDHRLPFPRQDLVHYIEIGDYDGQIHPCDVDKIVAVLNNPDMLYSIYVRGAEHTRTCYSMQARSKYVVGLIEKFVEDQL